MSSRYRQSRCLVHGLQDPVKSLQLYSDRLYLKHVRVYTMRQPNRNSLLTRRSLSENCSHMRRTKFITQEDQTTTPNSDVRGKMSSKASTPRYFFDNSAQILQLGVCQSNEEYTHIQT